MWYNQTYLCSKVNGDTDGIILKNDICYTFIDCHEEAFVVSVILPHVLNIWVIKDIN